MAEKRDEFRRRAESQDLLADVRASIAAEAALETERRMAAEAARRDEAERRLQETSALHRAEIEARLAAEAARQRAAAEERALRTHAESAPLAVPGPARTPVVHPDTGASLGATHPADAFAAEVVSLGMTAPNPPARGRTAFFAIVVGLPVACVTAVALALVARDRGAAPPEAPPSVESPGVASGAAAASSARQAGSSAPVALTGAAGKTTTAAGEGRPATGPVATPPRAGGDRRTGARSGRRDDRPANTPRRSPAPPSNEKYIIDFGKD